MACMVVLPAGASETLTGNDVKFLNDVTKEGLPLLTSIPDIMKEGFFNGTDSSVATISQEESDALNAFSLKINEYTLSDEITPVRDQVNASVDVFKKDLTEYATLVNTCGSCVHTMNEMYPRLLEEVNKTNTIVSQFNQTA
ncbi:MAG: hypothetical protein LUQ50_13845 [Methanospirillum sp.]|uniref:hypothetical protein n=1 Tax=Methanospirillum sp. TaxID=45200 RepID=UPI002375A4FF|nr:hypothetical protein [Methanospirillum sp.]MDD1730138.1 hypothetical protein [Methanospirillum sp.]